ncbi:TolC family outer membrane protein [Larsenimonas suaedae]|uniref:TolC family outer membrane protein n=1 Tax=Larsenimonas suaedae TaxID=1851019 RepID=A0ABU1GRI7_9GAMM|nr:TolC family outer membrane protein [Larsenimonas suaedae]MCM2972570.1 TolC family outer membrane protein [Larsenimonas suaedae]MDR5894634.1 TolC family outer membrane protein [Larsenimonas suaedae]
MTPSLVWPTTLACTVALIASTLHAETAAGAERLPSLPALFAEALAHDAVLSSTRLEARARGEEVPKARAGLLPRLDASYGYSYTESDNIYTDGDLTACINNPDTGEPAGGEDYAQRCAGYSTDQTRRLQLTQPLFSMERFRKLDKARAIRQAALEEIAVAERDLALELAKTYMNAFYASRRIELLKAKTRALTLQVRQAKRAFELGIGDRIDLLAAQASLDQTRADQAEGHNDLDDALSHLTRLTGVRPDFDRVALKDITSLDLPAPKPLETLSQRIANNADVRLAQKNQQVARKDTHVREASYYPEVSLNLSYQNRDSDDPYRDSTDKSASVQANLNLFMGGYTQADIRQGELRQRASQAELGNARRTAYEQLVQYHRRLDTDAQRLRALARSITSSRTYLEAADKGAALGIRDLVDVLDARATLFDQRIQYVDGVRQLVMDRLNLAAATGALDTHALRDVMALLERITGPAPDRT